MRQEPINRKRPCSFDQKHQPKGDRKQVNLKSLAFLVTGPIHEETNFAVDRQDGNYHIGDDSQSGHPYEKTDQQTEPTQELGRDSQNCEPGRNTRLLKRVHHRVEAGTAKPAQCLLRTMSKKYDAENDAKHGEGVIILCLKKSLKHRLAFLQAVPSPEKRVRKCPSINKILHSSSLFFTLKVKLSFPRKAIDKTPEADRPVFDRRPCI